MTSIANVKSGRITRAAGIVVPAVLMILGTTGVVVKPNLGLEAARALHRDARAREIEFEAESQRAQRFERAGGTERLAQAMTEITRRIPEQATPLELHSVIALTARHDRLALTAIEIGEARDADFESIDDRITLTPVEVKGRGTLGDAVSFVADLRGAGCAVAINECTLARILPDDPAFDFKLSLSFHQRAELARVGSASHRGDP